jgi:DNA-binding IclR family transcriptional regulator
MTVSSSPAPGTRAKSAARALMLLELLAEDGGGLTFTEMSTRMGLPKSSLHELLSILTERSFIQWHADDRTYSLGIRVWECGQAYLGQRDLLAEARPIMRSVVGAANETVQLAVLDGVEVVYIERVDSSQPLRLQTSVGTRQPAHATGLGKVMLADLRESELVRRFENRPVVRLTPNTIDSVADLLEELRTVRSAGFAVDNEEYSIGLRCVAVPIRDHAGETVAAMSMSVPRMRGDARSLARNVALLGGGAAEVSRRLGCPENLARNSFDQDVAALEETINEILQRDDRHRDAALKRPRSQ